MITLCLVPLSEFMSTRLSGACPAVPRQQILASGRQGALVQGQVKAISPAEEIGFHPLARYSRPSLAAGSVLVALAAKRQLGFCAPQRTLSSAVALAAFFILVFFDAGQGRSGQPTWC
jgi:hypothetical protein